MTVSLLTNHLVFRFAYPACNFILYTADQAEGFVLYDEHCVSCWSALHGIQHAEQEPSQEAS